MTRIVYSIRFRPSFGEKSATCRVCVPKTASSISQEPTAAVRMLKVMCVPTGFFPSSILNKFYMLQRVRNVTHEPQLVAAIAFLSTGEKRCPIGFGRSTLHVRLCVYSIGITRVFPSWETLSKRMLSLAWLAKDG